MYILSKYYKSDVALMEISNRKFARRKPSELPFCILARKWFASISDSRRHQQFWKLGSLDHWKAAFHKSIVQKNYYSCCLSFRPCTHVVLTEATRLVVPRAPIAIKSWKRRSYDACKFISSTEVFSFKFN